MKKIYLSLLALTLFNVCKAQTLTATSEPTIGDIEGRKGYDSVGVVPKAAGTGLNWNFSAFTLNTGTVNSAYTSTVGTPNNTLFPGATIVENEGGGTYNYWKSVSTPAPQYELVGIIVGGLNVSYTNSAIYLTWPAAFGYTNTDTYGGPASGGMSGTASGSITTTIPGSGTLTLPGGSQLSNVLQVKTFNNINIAITSPASTITVLNTSYLYYHSSTKFPVLTVEYESSTGNPNTVSITVNNAVVLGLNEKNFDATFQIFPNPAKDAFNLKLNNLNNDKGIVEIFNVMGQLTKTIDLGNGSILEQSVSLQGLSSGVYTVKTTIGNRSSSRKLILE